VHDIIERLLNLWGGALVMAPKAAIAAPITERVIIFDVWNVRIESIVVYVGGGTVGGGSGGGGSGGGGSGGGGSGGGPSGGGGGSGDWHGHGHLWPDARPKWNPSVAGTVPQTPGPKGPPPPTPMAKPAAASSPQPFVVLEEDLEPRSKRSRSS
jgi:hypothetical protein